MYLDRIQQIYKALTKTTLPGRSAQLIMAPRYPWQEQAENIDITELTAAGVMVLLYPKNNVPHIAFTVRAENIGTHSGEVSLPGGKTESEDQKLADTALRETSEELGINPQDITIIGALTPVPTLVSHFFVHPFVGAMKTTPTFTPNTNEVAQVLEIPLDVLQKTTVEHMSVSLSINGEAQEMIAPYFEFEGNKIWGITAMIVNEFLATTRANQEDVENSTMEKLHSDDRTYHMVQV
ncbi:MAG: CoA pyrophosphatase [Patescibacteria group bacterium]